MCHHSLKLSFVANWETIKKRAEFVRLQKSDVKWIRPGFIALATPRQPGAVLLHRIGYVVTKKIDKRAVVRNRIKRRLRALVADTQTVKLPLPLDIVLIARAPALVQDFAALQMDWQRAMQFFRSKFKPVIVAGNAGIV